MLVAEVVIRACCGFLHSFVADGDQNLKRIADCILLMSFTELSITRFRYNYSRTHFI